MDVTSKCAEGAGIAVSTNWVKYACRTSHRRLNRSLNSELGEISGRTVETLVAFWIGVPIVKGDSYLDYNAGTVIYYHTEPTSNAHHFQYVTVRKED